MNGEAMAQRGSIYVFEKNYDTRLEDYRNVLSFPTKIVPASQIRAEWSCDVELVIEPVGWQAFWNIPRSTCEDLNISYPTIVFVEVLGVSHSTLTAMVKIIAVQDDLSLPAKHKVPLIQLYVSVKQKNPSLDIAGTANCVDELRFFYNYLWMPWDDDDDDDKDWVEQHLESRLKLYFDMRQNINKETRDIMLSLISEGKEIRSKIVNLEYSLPDDELEDMHEDAAEETCMLMQLHFRLQQIKAEMDLMENPSMRNFLEKSRHLKNMKDNIDVVDTEKSYFVWGGGTVEEFQKLSNKIQTMLSENMPIKIYGHLDEVLNMCTVGDTVLLGRGKYPIKPCSELPKRGTIMGICDTEDIILCPKGLDALSSLFDITDTEISLKNISINLGELKAAIIIRQGCTINMTDCKIYADNVNRSSVKWGVVVMPDAKLVFNNTVFQGLGTGLFTYRASEVILNKCRFENCYEGIMLNDNVHFTATECSFKNIESYAVIVESKHLTCSDIKVGNSELVADMSEISLDNCTFDKEKSVILKPMGSALTEALDTNIKS